MFSKKLLTLININDTIDKEVRKSRVWLPPYIKEVMLMVEYLITIIYILFYALVGITIITLALIIALVIILSKK